MIVIGINAYHGDAAVCFLEDGELLYAAEEERFNRIKHCAGFPYFAIKDGMRFLGIKPEHIDHVAISRNPRAHLHKKLVAALSQGLAFTPQVLSRLQNLARVRSVKTEFATALEVDPAALRAKFHNVEHHRAHLASAFYMSPFERAALFSIDGFGDFISTMFGTGLAEGMEVIKAVEYPHSLGILYTAISQYIGFPKYGDEGKVMGLAPYGTPNQLEAFKSLVRPKDDGGFELGLDYFQHHTTGVSMTWDKGSPEIGRIYSDKLIQLLGPARQPGEELADFHRDVAASLQATLEDIALKSLNRLYEKTKLQHLGMAGGVALNCSLNGKIPLQTPFNRMFIPPSAGDSGTALGAALYVCHHVLKHPRTFVLKSAAWGPAYSNDEIRSLLAREQIPGEELQFAPLLERTAKAIAEGKVVGWFRGKMEFGPRALGQRSILCDPRRHDMKDILNRRIKHREPFRPFAPSVLEEKGAEWFDDYVFSPFMLHALSVKKDKRDQVPAITHVDGTGRLQTVNRDDAPEYHAIISAFEKESGVPMVLNTSFNENEPIVASPHQALECFKRTHMDVLVLGDFYLERKAGSPA